MKVAKNVVGVAKTSLKKRNEFWERDYKNFTMLFIALMASCFNHRQLLPPWSNI
jgi:hypothetical protein